MQKKFSLHFHNLLKQVRPTPSTLILACSGGVDSMALLHLVNAHFYRKKHTPQLLVVSIDHKQRVDSTKDLLLVRKYAKKLNLEFKTFTLKTKPKASENDLRKLRYEKLFALAKKEVLLTAHHLDDALETYLYRLLRGANPNTLQTIAEHSKQKDVTLIRPLLSFTKEEILKYAKENQIPWREDSTNQEKTFTRNRIRLELLPMLESIQPRSKEHLHTFFKILESKQPKTPKLLPKQYKFLRSTGLPVKKAHLTSMRQWILNSLGDLSDQTTRYHWETLEKLLSEQKQTPATREKCLEFPGGHKLVFRRNLVFWMSF